MIPSLPERVARAPKTPPARWLRFMDVHRTLGFKFWALISGGGALPGPLEHFWNGTGFVLVQGYGMTETTALITLNHPFHVAEGSIGKPLSGREVKLGPDGEVLVRGESISGATWSHGELKQRTDEWLATGDLAELEPGGELRFLGRKSEVIVTGSGVNVHPEDLEAAVEQEPGVAACAVVSVETPQGPEPMAVLAMRSGAAPAAAAVEHANSRLADYQRIRRWEIWPEPDLPRTSTGKVRRKAVAEWLAARHTNGTGAAAKSNGAGASKPAMPKDWLLALIAQITGEEPPGSGDELRLSEDLHLDSLGRVQLNAAVEERLGAAPENGALDQVETLGQLRKLLGLGAGASGNSSGGQISAHVASPVAATRAAEAPAMPPTEVAQAAVAHTEVAQTGVAQPGPRAETVPAQPAASQASPQPSPQAAPETSAKKRANYVYPHWPWWWPVRLLRNFFTEAVMRPLIWILANPRLVGGGKLDAGEPMLIVSNHITEYDGPLLKYALPRRTRESARGRHVGRDA